MFLSIKSKGGIRGRFMAPYTTTHLYIIHFIIGLRCFYRLRVRGGIRGRFMALYTMTHLYIIHFIIGLRCFYPLRVRGVSEGGLWPYILRHICISFISS